MSECDFDNDPTKEIDGDGMLADSPIRLSKRDRTSLRGKWCMCTFCGDIGVCSGGNDYYSGRIEVGGPLACESCMRKGKVSVTMPANTTLANVAQVEAVMSDGVPIAFLDSANAALNDSADNDTMPMMTWNDFRRAWLAEGKSKSDLYSAWLVYTRHGGY